MPHQMRYSVLTVALACVVLFRHPGGSLAMDGWLRGTMWSFSQVVRLGTIDVPKADQGKSGAQRIGDGPPPLTPFFP